MAAYISAGVDAAATNEFAHARETKNYKQSVMRNRFEYVIAFFKKMNCRLPEGTVIEMWDAQNRKTTLDVSGYFSLLVGNIGSYAGGWQPFKQTDYSDGLLEVVPLNSLFDFFKCTLTAVPFLARFLGKQLVPSIHCTRVAICSENKFEVQVDGEGRNDLGESSRLEVKYMGLAQILVLD
jgi:diacylglycerol kinase family enzyme